MSSVQLFAVTPAGPQPVHLEPVPTSIHDLPETLPYGVYTAFRTFEHNKFLGLADHVQRLRHSISVLGWNYEIDQVTLRRVLHEVCSNYPFADARVRIDVLAQVDPRVSSESRTLITLAPFTPIPDVYYQKGVRLGVAPRLRRHHPRAKTAHFIFERSRYLLGKSDAFDYLLLGEGGLILEGSTSNFYALCKGIIWTAGQGVLEGIARKIVLQLIAEADIPLRLQPIALADVEQCDEAFISSSSRGIVPVVTIDKRNVGDAEPGPITRQLMTAYNDYVQKAIRRAIETPARG